MLFHLSSDPFAAPIIPKFREFDISIVCGSSSGSDATAEFVSIIRAIRKVRPNDPVVIPRCASFFDFQTISVFEQQFPISRDPQYKDIRNFIVSIFRIFNTHYLPYTLCRRNIKAPAHLTLKIWKFLNKYGLINYKVNEKTIPSSLIPTFDKWPQLIYGINERLYTDNQYQKRIHPKVNMPGALSVPQYEFLSKSFVNNIDNKGMKMQQSEVGALMSFRNWNKKELLSLSEALKRCETWDSVADFVGSKTKDECVEMAASLPMSYSANIVLPSNSVSEDGIIKEEMTSDIEMMKKMALSENENLRIVYRTVKSIGNEQAQAILKRQNTDSPSNSLEAVGILAMDKIAKNTQRMKELHKQRILDCLNKSVQVLKQSIKMKKELIDEAQFNINENRPSESELTSSDEKNWQSGNEENSN